MNEWMEGWVNDCMNGRRCNGGTCSVGMVWHILAPETPIGLSLFSQTVNINSNPSRKENNESQQKNNTSTEQSMNTTKNSEAVLSETTYHHLPMNLIQDRIWMLQMAQREHTLTKPPVNGIALILPEPVPLNEAVSVTLERAARELSGNYDPHGDHNGETTDDENDKRGLLLLEQSRAHRRHPRGGKGEKSSSTNKTRRSHRVYPKITTKPGVESMMCIVPQWPARLFMRGNKLHLKKKRRKRTNTLDSSTMRLLEESSRAGEWS